MQMFALRVFISPQDNDLFVKKNLSRDVKYFEEAIIFSSKVNEKALATPSTIRAQKYSLKISVPLENGVMAGVVSRQQTLSVHDRDFVEHDIENYPPVIWMWERTEQILLVEKKTTLFQTADSTAKAFEDLANNELLKESGLRASITPCLEDDDFWNEYHSFQYVERVEFSLSTPNLFGSTQEELQKELKGIEDQTNASRVTTILENKDGNLKLQNAGWIQNLVKWVKNGGGKWKMKGKRTLKSKSTTIDSTKTAKIILFDGQISEVELSNYSAEEISTIMARKQQEYTFTNGILEDDSKANN